MTFNDIVEAVNGFCENRVTKLSLRPWADAEVSKICQRKRYWWRKKLYTFSTIVNQPTYDLSLAAAAPDFQEAVNMALLGQGQNTPFLSYVENADKVQAIVNDANSNGTTGSPKSYLIEPGYTQTIRLTPIPNTVQSFGLMYWAMYSGPSKPAKPIPLVPGGFHYVVQLSLMERAFLYLFGQNDPRHQAVHAELYGSGQTGGELAKLDGFKRASVEGVDEWGYHGEDVVTSARL